MDKLKKEILWFFSSLWNFNNNLSRDFKHKIDKILNVNFQKFLTELMRSTPDKHSINLDNPEEVKELYHKIQSDHLYPLVEEHHEYNTKLSALSKKCSWLLWISIVEVILLMIISGILTSNKLDFFEVDKLTILNEIFILLSNQANNITYVFLFLLIVIAFLFVQIINSLHKINIKYCEAEEQARIMASSILSQIEIDETDIEEETQKIEEILYRDD